MYSTHDLVEELKTRVGVLPAVLVAPHDNYEIHLPERVISDIGPAIVLVVID